MKQRTRILIYTLIAITVVILGTIAIITNHNADKPITAEEHLDLGRIYLNDLSYENAVLEFTEAIKIEPLNADAYLGLAEAYAGMGDIPKAVETLEKGIEKTGDEWLKKMLEELQTVEETTAEAEIETTTTTETTTVSLKLTVEFITIKRVQYSTSLTELDLSGMNLTNEDIKDLDKMVNLNSLTLLDNQISDINVLKGLINLTQLNLANNQISDISALKSLTNLTELWLNFNQISDINCLENLTRLTSLTLEAN